MLNSLSNRMRSNRSYSRLRRRERKREGPPPGAVEVQKENGCTTGKAKGGGHTLEAQRDAEDKERADAEKKKERLRAIQLPQPMTSKSDLMEYLNLFEEVVTIKEIPQDQWSTLLTPLLNNHFRGVATKLYSLWDLGRPPAHLEGPNSTNK